jgi:hypothetical protein
MKPGLHTRQGNLAVKFVGSPAVPAADRNGILFLANSHVLTKLDLILCLSATSEGLMSRNKPKGLEFEAE